MISHAGNSHDMMTKGFTKNIQKPLDPIPIYLWSTRFPGSRREQFCLQGLRRVFHMAITWPIRKGGNPMSSPSTDQSASFNQQKIGISLGLEKWKSQIPTTQKHPISIKVHNPSQTPKIPKSQFFIMSFHSSQKPPNRKGVFVSVQWVLQLCHQVVANAAGSSQGKWSRIIEESRFVTLVTRDSIQVWGWDWNCLNFETSFCLICCSYHVFLVCGYSAAGAAPYATLEAEITTLIEIQNQIRLAIWWGFPMYHFLQLQFSVGRICSNSLPSQLWESFFPSIKHHLKPQGMMFETPTKKNKNIKPCVL